MKQFSKFKQAFVSKQEAPKQDKTDVLSGELQDAEKRIDLIKQACESTAKHVKNCLHCPSKDLQSLDKATDKRLKKVPELLLGTNMIDSFKQIENSDSMKFESVLGQVLNEAGGIEQYLGNKLVLYEENVERNVLLPLQKLVDKDLPNIEKTKRLLTKLSGDMDSQQAKYNQANRHSLSAGTTKINDLKDDLDDTQQKLDQCRDNLAAEMYQMIAREPEISEHIVDFLRAQKEYHWAAYAYLNELLPSVEAVLAKSNHKPVYGKSLEEHLESSGRTIAYPIEVCVCGLMLIGLEEEGLFRIAGSTSKVKKLKAAVDAGMLDLNRLLTEYSDPHVIANAMKCYLREMPSPLLTFELHQDWVEAVQIPNPQSKLQALWTVVDKLRCNYKQNFDNLSYLIKFLRELSKQQSVNKMTPANIAIVIAPNLLWAENIDDVSSDIPMGLNMTKLTPLYTVIVEQLVTHADYFFPEDVNFFMSYSRPTDAELLANGAADETGSGGHSELEGMNSSKRSQSSSSLEDHNSPPHGSPKPVLRRKNKPAPVPPSVRGTYIVDPGAAKAPPSSSGDSGAQKESLHKGVSIARRDGMYVPPPSPSQMNNRKGGSSGSTSATGEVVASMPAPKITPPKPPQPQLNQHQKDLDNKGDRAKPFSQNYSSTLKHKSSFNSGSNTSSDSASSFASSGSPGNKSGANSGPSPYYSNSLPRHFHTDNSYKNQRAPRPPSIFAATPTVPTSTPAVSQSTSQVRESQNQNQPQCVSEAQHVEPLPTPSSSTAQESVSESVSQVVSNVAAKSMPYNAATIGFERLEAELRENDVSTSSAKETVISSDHSDKGDDVDKDPATQPSLSSPPSDAPRPVPAPRSSLLQNASKEKENVPVVKERPTLMAKPRDLAKRTHHGPVTSGSTASTGDLPVGEYVIHHHGHGGSAATHSDTESHSVDGYQQKNGLNDNMMPPPSPRAPNRPPRPQPPPPPKVKAESTDL